MPKRKLTKNEDDIRRGLRPIDRYEPRARSIGGAWRMVKCIDGAYVDAEQHDEVVEYLRKSAEINPTQSTHDDDTCPHLVRANLLEAENARLKAEVERWSVAGELMLDHLNTGWASEHRVIEAIEAAKEGKQP